MTAYLVCGMAVFLVVAVNWIERSAVARAGTARLIKAMAVKEQSLQDVLSMSGEEVAGHRASLKEAQAEIDELRRRIEERPEVAPIDEYCVPGCKPRWGQVPNEGP